MSRIPIIGLCADSRLVGPHPNQCAGDKYIRAVAEGAGGLPLIIPTSVSKEQLASLLDTLDGILLPGSYANVHPSYYSDEAPFDESLLDPLRDPLALALAELAIEKGVPLLGVCRGAQEINVALGGTLYQQVHDIEGLADHREDKGATLAEQYSDAHEISLVEGGILAQLAGGLTATVNSLHGQGIRNLSQRASVEARAPDGLIEAYSITEAPAFALAVQWHPEWRFEEKPFYTAIWQAFGDACRQHASTRQ